MESPILQLVPWLLLGIPILSIFKWVELRRTRRENYPNFVALREFPILQITLGKLGFFALIGLGSIFLRMPVDRTLVALPAIGVCGYLLETTFVTDRPLPTPGYLPTRKPCPNCRISLHGKCLNLRTLDGFQGQFKTDGKYIRPVCCCGFRLGEWKEVET